jgi:hypothetical protein
MNPAFETPLRLYTLLMLAEADARSFYVSYEVIAADEADAARFAIGDLVARGEKALDVEHAEVVAIANPMAQPGVRFRTGRAYFETKGEKS